MRVQPDNIKSLNIVSEVATFFGLLYTGINHETVGLTTELLSTLVEFASVSGKLAILLTLSRLQC
jgi:hypothetical protein